MSGARSATTAGSTTSSPPAADETPIPRTSELKDALDGRPRRQGGRTALRRGRRLSDPRGARRTWHPTYTKDVAPILQKNCQECHRPGQVGPFALETYEQARKRAADIAAVVEDRAMPPWKAAPHFGLKFKDERTLPEQDIATIVSWAESGAPEGDRRDLPPAPDFPDDWTLGKPDLVVDIGADFAIPASTEDIYRCFVVPTSLPEDRVRHGDRVPGGQSPGGPPYPGLRRRLGQGAEARRGRPRPGLLLLRRSGRADPAATSAAGRPAIQPSPLPEGIGRLLPKGADVIVQVHYHPSGKPETDRTRIGLHFARKPIRQTLHWTRRPQPRASSCRPETPTSRSRPSGRSPSTSSPTP